MNLLVTLNSHLASRISKLTNNPKEGKMKQSIFAITAVLTICASAAAQPDTLWTKTFGGSSDDFGNCVQQTSDGGYIIAGNTSSYGAGGSDVYLIKTDASGIEQWTKTFGGSGGETGFSVQQTSDGGYIIVGTTYSYGTGDNGVYLIKTDVNGDTSWTKTLGGSDDDYGYSVQQTADGGYIIAGYTNSYGAGNSDVYLIKTDTEGNQQWYRTFGGSLQDYGYSVRQTSDGGYIIAGEIYSLPTGGPNVLLIKTDVNGNEEWYQTFGGSGWDYGESVQQTSDGGYIITGWTYSYGAGLYDVYLIKTDANGNEQWYQTFGGSENDKGYSVQQTSEGGYIIAGYTESYSVGWSDVYIIKTDALGNQQWYKTFGGIYKDIGYSVQLTSEGGYIVAGFTESFGAGNSDIYLIRLSYIYFIGPDSLYFSTVEVHSSDTKHIFIYNDDLVQSAQIDAIYHSLSVFTFDSSAIGAVIPPGDSLEITVTFTPDSSMDYIDTLYVAIEDVVLSAVLTGTGIGAYISLSEDSLDFGYWELNAPYPTRDFTIENLGNDTLEVDSIISDNPAFILSTGTGLTLLAGETSNPVAITFQPPGGGFHDGYILLPNNAYNVEDDTAMVYVSGWWEYTPAPVYDLTVSIEGIDAVLNWSQVDTSIYGNPIAVDYYLIYFVESLSYPYNFLACVQETTYTHETVVQFSPSMFYFVEAYLGDIGILDAIISSGAPISRKELLEAIFTGN